MNLALSLEFGQDRYREKSTVMYHYTQTLLTRSLCINRWLP